MKKRVIIFIMMLVYALLYYTVPYYSNIVIAEKSGVLEDLKLDKDFNISDYPEQLNDYSIDIITIAEGVDNELFIYCYQPSKNTQASSINISTEYSDRYIKFINYKLSLISQSGVFYKYKVLDFVVDSDKSKVRVYEISSIYRIFNNDIDNEYITDNAINEVAFSVGKRYEIASVGDSQSIGVKDIELVHIEDKYVGLVRYYIGYKTDINGSEYELYKDCHFIAFKSDRNIDKLLEASVMYTQIDYKEEKSMNTLKNDYITSVIELNRYNNEISELTSDMELNFTIKPSLFSGDIEYSAYRIQTINDFIASENNTYYKTGKFISAELTTELKEKAIENIEDMQYVLRYNETAYKEHRINTGNYLNPVNYYYYYSLMENVTILRLKFESEGQVYNLGVVDDKRVGDSEPSNNQSIKIELSDSVKNFFDNFIKIISILVLVIIISSILPHILNLVILIIKIPFKIIKLIIGVFK